MYNNVYSPSFLKKNYISVYTYGFNKYLTRAGVYLSHIFCSTLKIWPQTFQFLSLHKCIIERMVKNKTKLFHCNEIWEVEWRRGRA